MPNVAATAKVKPVNYTDEQEALLKAQYAAGVDVAEIAAQVGKSVKSVVAKLSRLGVYQKKEYKTKAGTPAVKKDEQADVIGRLLGLSANDTDSLAKANKVALAAVVKALQERNDDILALADEENERNNPSGWDAV